MKRTLTRAFSFVIVLAMLMSLLVFPTSAATYRTAKNGPSASYKTSVYYQNYLKIPLTGDGPTDTLALALSQLGYHEGASVDDMAGDSSAKNNFTEYNYNMGSQYTGSYGGSFEWCACFCSWALFQAHCTDFGEGGTYSNLCRHHPDDPEYIWREIGVGWWNRNLKAANAWIPRGSGLPQSGDLVIFRSNAHIGLVVYHDGTYVYTVEGNTSDQSGLEPSGGGVYFKKYALDSTLIDGYGRLPYKRVSSVNKIDYSGANPTAGLWMSNAFKYIYSDAACTVKSGKSMSRFTLFEATGVTADKKALIVNYNGTTGYVALNSDRVIQVTSSVSGRDDVITAREKLQALSDVVKNVVYKNYTAQALTALRAAYADASAVLVNSEATTEQLESAYTKLNTAYKNTGVNEVTDAIYITDMNTTVRNGTAMIFTPEFGTVNSTDAGHSWSANMRVKWDESVGAYVIVGTLAGEGPSKTPSVTLPEDELLIVVHSWEEAVPGSAENYNNVFTHNDGLYKLVFDGIDLQKGTVDIGSYIAFEKIDGAPIPEPVGNNVAFKKTYTALGIYKEEGTALYPDEDGKSLTNGKVPSKTSYYDDDVYTGFNINSEEYSANGYAAITVDLGDIYELDRFVAHVASKYHSEVGITAPQKISVYVSSDGENWKFAAEAVPEDDDSVSGIAVSVIPDNHVVGQYVQYRFTSSSYWTMVGEVEAYGVTSDGQEPEPPVHIHESGDDMQSDEIGHWYVCECGEILEYGEHICEDADNCMLDKRCAVCGYMLQAGTEHTPGEWVVVIEPEIGVEGVEELCCSVCGCLLDTRTTEALKAPYLLGDVNNNGEIDSGDYTLVKRAYFSTYLLDDDEFLRADVNENNEIDGQDYALIKRVYFGTYSFEE